MTIDIPTGAAQEPVVSRDTAISCLVRLGMQSGGDMDVGSAPSRGVLDGDSLSVSRLVELAGEFGLRLNRARLDWQGLQTTGFGHPILARLKNTNVVVLTGGGRNGAEEIAVWDPLHRDEEVFFVPRAEFEQAWSGDALIIGQQPSSAAEVSSFGLVSEGALAPDVRSKTPPTVNDIAQEKLAPIPVHGASPPSPPSVRPVRAPRRSQITRLWLISAAILATSSLGVFFMMRPADDKAAANSIPAMKASERLPTQNGSPAAATPTAATPTAGVAAGIPAAVPAPAAPSAPAAPTPEPALAIAAPDSGARLGEPGPTIAATPEPPATVTAPAAEPPLAEPTPAAATTPPLRTPEPSSTAAAAATAPAGLRRLTPVEITALVARGDALLGTGDVASARDYYRRAADAGDGQAAIRLGETFDPGFLEQAHLRSARGDLGTALSWYRHARDLGAPEAEVLLKTREAK